MRANKDTTTFQRLVEELAGLTELISKTDKETDARAAKRARQTLDEVARRLDRVAVSLDPILRPSSIFDPSDPTTAGRIVALTLVAQPAHPLARIPDFYGAGVYAIYYRGDFPSYLPLSGRDHPIYIGKADPESSGAGNVIDQGRTLSLRLREHAKSIRAAEGTLDIEDFACRFLVTQSGFQKSAEAYLIDFFKPIWNSETKIAFGLGKHGDSSTTRVNKRSPWDTLHPGRKWADSTAENQKSRTQIEREITSHFADYPPYHDIHQIFDTFVQDMRQIGPDRFTAPDGGTVRIEETEV